MLLILIRLLTSTAYGTDPVDIGEISDITDLALEDLLTPVVLSASKTLEQANEAPVPVTIITGPMLRAIGARNLKDALETYVPGFTNITDHNELNTAVRGVYASSQQKVLIMVDGHRLNSRAYSMAAPDFSISVDPTHIQQIEVLRGPGSSVYGNVALTAVVNIVTKDGADVDGLVMRVGAGNYGQRQATGTFGSALNNGDLLVWASVHKALGEEVAISRRQDYAAEPNAGVAIVGGDRDPGSYDVGVSVDQGDVRFYGESRFGKHTEPFTAAGATGQVYDYDIMRPLSGQGSGLGSQSNHLEIGWTPRLSEAFDLDLAAYFDTNRIVGNTTTGYESHIGIGWNENDEGVTAQLTGKYKAAGSGLLLLGAQAETFEVVDSWLPTGTSGEWEAFGDVQDAPLLVPGREQTYSAYAQLKHSFPEQLIVNVGARVDVKQRRPGDRSLGLADQDNIANLSPRLALIWHPAEDFSTKLSYAESFVDAPYWYRYTTLASYAGAISLRPERLRAIQLTPEVTALDRRFRNTLNFAYNDLFDFIFRDNDANPDAGEAFYRNAGSLRSLVIEEEVAFTEKAYQLRGNATYQRPLSVKNYAADPQGARLAYVPAIVANAIVDVNVLQPLGQTGWVDLAARYTGPQYAPIRATSLENPNAEKNLQNESDASIVLDAGLRFENITDWLSVDGRVYNLLDQDHSQGGSTLFPYPQPGRWFSVNLEFKARP